MQTPLFVYVAMPDSRKKVASLFSSSMARYFIRSAKYLQFNVYNTHLRYLRRFMYFRRILAED